MDRLYGYNQRMPSNGYFWVTIFPVVALAGALRAAWSPLIDLPYNGAWDAFCYYWDDGANFVDNASLNRKPETPADLWEIALQTKINVFEPLGWLLKAVVRHQLLSPFDFGFISHGGGAFDQRRMTLLLHGLNGWLLFVVTVKLLAMRRGSHARLGEETEGPLRAHVAAAKKGGSNSDKSGTMAAGAAFVRIPPGSSSSSWTLRTGALLSSVLWVVHPLRAEVVGWPSCQPYALAGSWLLLGSYAYLCWLEHPDACGRGVHAWFRGCRWLALALVCYVAAFLSKAAALPFPAMLSALDVALAPCFGEVVVPGAPFSPKAVSQTKYWRRAAVAKVPFAAVGLLLASQALHVNKYGTARDSDVFYLAGLPERLHKASLTLCMYASKIMWPIEMRPHYNIKTAVLAALGTFDVDPSKLVRSNADVAVPPGAPFLAAATAVGTIFVLMWALASFALAQMGQLSPRGAPSSLECRVRTITTTTTTSSVAATTITTITTIRKEAALASGELAHTATNHKEEPVTNTTTVSATAKAIQEPRATPCSFSSLEPSVVLAVAVHWLGMWAPVCGVVQHGMVQMGGDRYAYLPDLALVPVGAVLFDSMLGGQAQYGALWKLPASSHICRSLRIVRRGAVIAAWLALVWACCRVSSSQLLIWRFDEAHLVHGIEQDPHDWRILDTYAELMVREGRPKATTHEVLRRANDATPDPAGRLVSVKALLVTAKNFMFLGDTDGACAMYIGAYENSAGWGKRAEWLSSPNLLNNVAICDIRSAYYLPEPEAAPFHARALACLEGAVAHAKVRGKSDLISVAEDNLRKFLSYRANGGIYEGTLMW